MSKIIRVLGIETSCDETAAAVVENGRHILSNVVSSQVPLHQPYGGVVPELASRAHVENVQSVVEAALKGQTPRGVAPFPRTLPVDVVAVTVGPGLVGSLLVGKVVAEMLAWVYKKPIIGVNHLEGHLLSILPGHPDLVVSRDGVSEMSVAIFIFSTRQVELEGEASVPDLRISL
jgi:N6-L-threonylcarbamoyladenine synthase